MCVLLQNSLGTVRRPPCHCVLCGEKNGKQLVYYADAGTSYAAAGHICLLCREREKKRVQNPKIRELEIPSIEDGRREHYDNNILYRSTPRRLNVRASFSSYTNHVIIIIINTRIVRTYSLLPPVTGTERAYIIFWPRRDL